MKLYSVSLVLLAGLAGPTLALPQIDTGPGFRVAGTIDLAPLCDEFPAVHGFLNGSTLVFDGSRIEHRSADGTILRDYGSVPGPVFPSFLEVTEDGSMAYFGESSMGMIRSLDLQSGDIRDLANLTFNYDFAFDVVPGLAYVTASAFGSATNSVFRIDLATGQAIQVADLGGFSGPIEVDGMGNVLVGVLPGVFPFPPGGTSLVRFDANDIQSGAVLTDEADGFLHAPGFNGMSSSDYDPRTDSVFVVETNAGAMGSDSVVWKLDPVGNRECEVARAGGYASGCQFLDAGTGSTFAPYRKASTSVRLSYRQCGGSIGDWRIWNVTPARPAGFFTGPPSGTTGAAAVEVLSGPPNGFAGLWLARSGSLLAQEIFVNLGATQPVALSATQASFGRRLPLMPLNAIGKARVDYTQDVSLEGAYLFQWLLFDAGMNLVGTSNSVVND